MADRLRFVSIVGARPQFIKAAVLSRAIRARHEEMIVHTGQHYDPEMSAVFFEEMAIPPPVIQLDSGSGTHAQQTASMLVGIEGVLIEKRPDWVVTFGDTNSTLAGALAAVKLHIPVAHVEAGLRSFNLAMPEEINRMVVDRISTALLCPSQTAVTNLAEEGIRRGVHLVGDVMGPALAMATPVARERSQILAALSLRERGYILATVHRAENTDSTARLRSIMAALDSLTEPVVFPVHPRTRKALDAIGYVPASNVRLTPPVGYIDMVRLITAARLIMTDSGGLQKEAYWAGVPCVTLRDETEWVETVQLRWNVIVGSEQARIVEAARTFEPPSDRPELYGSAGSAERCIEALECMSGGAAARKSRHGNMGSNSVIPRTNVGAPDLQSVRTFWEHNPVAARAVPYPLGTPEYFSYYDALREANETPEFSRALHEYASFAGRRVLDVGCGNGYVLSRYAAAGALVHGVDLTEAAIHLCRSRFALMRLPGRFLVGSAESLPFDDRSFDCVCSMGVLHHTPDTPRAIGEVFRVLRPGGRVILMFYHRDSLQYRLKFPLQKWLDGVSIQESINRVDGVGNPKGDVYSRSELVGALNQFRDLELFAGVFPWHVLGPFGRRIPDRAREYCERRWGWFLYAKAVRP